tara:strand:- start:946 stop:1119 length:174 start_codon:yes stop_codon:yes gene_type:complete
MSATVTAALQAAHDQTWHPLCGRSLFARPALQSDERYYHRVRHATGRYARIVFEGAA